MQHIVFTIFLIFASLASSAQAPMLRYSPTMQVMPEKEMRLVEKHRTPEVAMGRQEMLALSANALPAAFACRPVAMFCRLEWRMERKSGIPLRFRLGTLEYVDWLEGKHERIRPN